MPDQEEMQLKVELHRKADELKRRTFEDESRKIAREADEHARQNTKVRFAEESRAYSIRLREAQEERQRQESALKTQEEQVLGKLRTEAAKKIEVRKREEEERKRREEEEKRRLEEAESLRREEELRAAVEQERSRREEERRRILEAEKKRVEEERLRKQKDLRHKEEEAKAHMREREERIQSLITRAQMFLNDRDFEHASVEVAKALVNDPANAEALELESKIKEAQGKKVEGAEGADTARRKERPPRTETAPITGRRKPYASALMIAAVIAILIVSILVILELRKSPSPGSVSVAVLPWSSPSDILEEKVLGSSLAEVTAAGLRDYKSMIVMDFASSYQLAHATTEPEQASFRLGFRYVLQGTIVRSGGKVTVGLQLIDSLRNPVWSGRFETPSESLAILASEVPRQLAAAMGSLPAEKPAGFAAVRIPPNGGAYLLYLRSMEMLHRPTRASTENALLLLRQATEQDGKIPEFFAATASVLATRAEQGWDQSDTALTRAKQLAAGAIALDPSISEGYRVLGNVLSLRKEFRAALTEFDNGLRYSPKSAAILLSRARVLLKLGKYQDAIAALGRAYDLSPRDPDLLQTFAVAQQLAGAIHRGSAYHLTAVQCADDSTAYLVGPFADAVVLDPELSVSQSERVAAACRLRLRMQPGDYVTMYRFGRLLQVTGKPLDGADLLGKAETELRSVLEHTPVDLRATMYLALTLTRRGKFPEAADLALRAAKLDKKNPEVKYRIAQMYSMQMYSQKEKKIDEKARDGALQALREAVTLSYRFDEVASADFYNLFERPEFRSAIEQAM